MFVKFKVSYKLKKKYNEMFVKFKVVSYKFN